VSNGWPKFALRGHIIPFKERFYFCRELGLSHTFGSSYATKPIKMQILASFQKRMSQKMACCDRKSRAACAQRFALWLQATIEIMRRNLSSRTLVIMFNRSHVNFGRATTSQSLLLLLAHATYIMVLFFTHIPFVVNHTINATPPEKLQQHPGPCNVGQKCENYLICDVNHKEPHTQN